MKIYLPLKNDILDRGDANSVWTNPYVSGGGLPSNKLIGNAFAAEFTNTDRLHLQSTSLISSLTVWTMQCWFYPYTDRSTSSAAERCLISNYPYGQSGNSSNIHINIYQGSFYINGIQIASSMPINTWHQLYLTCDGTNIELYYDNQSVLTIPRGSKGFKSGLTIGNEQGNYGWDTVFNGGITQFQLSDIYNDTKLPLRYKLIYIADNNEVWGMV